MSRSPVDADIVNRSESSDSPTGTALNSTTRRFPSPNFLNLWNLDAPKYGDTSATYWKLYGSGAEIYDENLVDGLNGNSGSTAFLATLFSSIIASFIIETYKMLLPSNGQNAAARPSSSALRINILLVLSFILSVMSAVGCALTQKWCESYKHFAYPRAAPHIRGRVRTYLFQGLKSFQISRVVDGIHVLLHYSLFLFFWGLSDFFYTVNHEFGIVTRYAVISSVVVYMLLSIYPLVSLNFPYYTPMTPPLRAAHIIIRIIIRSPQWLPQWIRNKPVDLTGLRYYDGMHFDKARLYELEAGKHAKWLEPYAMKWLFTGSDLSDSDMDKFLEALPGYVSSSHTDKGRLGQYLSAEHIQSRIKEHFITCATSVELSDEARIARVSSCVKALVLIFQYNHKCKDSSSEPYNIQSQRIYIQGLIEIFQPLCSMDDHTTALRASCIRALAVQGFLSEPVPLHTGTTDSSWYPAYLIPIYNYLSPNDDTAVSWFDDGPTPRDLELWMGLLLHDGPLANLTKLAQAIRYRDHVSPSILTFCWTTLDILLTQLGTIHSENFTRAQSDFDDLHEDTRAYVSGEEAGRCMTPLLEILDVVARGRRILMVFSSSPKYHSGANVVFGKEYLRNGELLEAFARCLPDFIAKNSSNVCTDVMEKVVNRDNLWTNLQVNLWNTQRSDRPIPEKLRIFGDFCTVLDIAFSVLEDSQDVDWLAPEFGSLSNHFESFTTHCFQGAFMGRATSFRVGIIKARFCRALLSQFKDDIDREGTLSFQSQWDVASFARLIYILGFRDKENADFWDSYVNGGHIGTIFIAKALEMIDMAARDGPLLIFCQLGRLVVMALPLKRSGLVHNDVEKVLNLQTKLVEDKRLPLMHGSDIVWEELGQLRELVNELRVNRTGENRKLLERLLQIIDEAFHLRSSGPLNSGREPTEKRRSLSPDPTTGPSGDIKISEGEAGYGQSSTHWHSTVQAAPEPGPPGSEIVHRSFGTFLSTIPSVDPNLHFQYTGASQSRTYTPMSVSTSSASMPTFATRGSSSTLSAPRRDAPTILQDHAITSLYRSSDHSDEDRLSPSPAFEEK